ncbi:MAG: VCBS repeat-containing protein, partial [Planctomycetes bacterium]|nr:VCBS repeat-containing protein [Planctomycetota bacterium]
MLTIAGTLSAQATFVQAPDSVQPLPFAGATNEPEAADVNLDGFPDVLVDRSGHGTVAIGYGDGDGGISSWQLTNHGFGAYDFFFADFDADGLPDLVGVNHITSTVSWSRNTTTVPGVAATFQFQDSWSSPTAVLSGWGPANLDDDPGAEFYVGRQNSNY